MKYLVKTPWWLRLYYRSFTWRVNTRAKEIFLTFDDGPHPLATPFVLETLQQYNAKATFFCIGKNVAEFTGIYNDILQRGHAVGNHTNDHLNGWKTANDLYVNNIALAESHITSELFRPPYGRIRKSQAAAIKSKFEVIMWDVLSGDFDTDLSPQQCLKNVTGNTEPGSIVVFHDSQKAFERLKVALPGTLEHFARLGYTFSALNR